LYLARRAWQCGRRRWIELAQRHGRAVPHAPFAEIDPAMSPRAPRARCSRRWPTHAQTSLQQRRSVGSEAALPNSAPEPRHALSFLLIIATT
jgi:hypothetical protein